MIGIINTNFGNINAIKNIYFDEGIDCKSVSNIGELDNVSKLIIPGIGNFDNVIFSHEPITFHLINFFDENALL